MTYQADIIVENGASWRYWDPVMQQWKRMVSTPTKHDDVMVTGVDINGEPITVYFRTDREGSWLGGFTK